eukprot:1716809-Alexandrium_andersonii.AAC.1
MRATGWGAALHLAADPGQVGGGERGDRRFGEPSRGQPMPGNRRRRASVHWTARAFPGREAPLRCSGDRRAPIHVAHL